MGDMKTQEQSLKYLFEQYTDECRYIKQLREASIKSNKEVFQYFMKQSPEIIHVSDLIPQFVMRFFRSLGERKSKASTIRSYYDRLMTFFRWLETFGHIERGALTSYITKPPSPRYDDSKALGKEDLAKIQSSITIHNLGNSLAHLRDTLILSTLIYTGMRKGELLNLRLRDIDFHNRLLKVEGKTSKSKKTRYIPIHPTLLLNIKAYLHERKKRGLINEYLYISLKHDTKLSAHGLVHWVRRYNEKSGVSFHLHQFRHTFACTLARANADLPSIQALLGHASIRMTERYLRSIRSETTRNVIECLMY